MYILYSGHCASRVSIAGVAAVSYDFDIEIVSGEVSEYVSLRCSFKIVRVQLW